LAPENVRSKAAALGIWQFTPGTGRLYLTINQKVDQRLDADKATRAAAKLLRDNYRALGNWSLAITAYNHGRSGMMRAKHRHGPDLTTIISDYRGPVFGYASMNFYAEFLAALEVYKNHEQYFGTLALDKPAGKAGQAAVRSGKVPPTLTAGKPVKVKPGRTVVASYKVRRGDTLHEISQRFGTPVPSLMKKNNLNNHTIYAGQTLSI